MTAILVDITPALATELIGNHFAARAPERYEDATAIREYADDMRDGVWETPGSAYNPVCIAGPNGWNYDGDCYPPGTIIDGWHRLNAVVMSGVTIRAYIDYDTEGAPA